MALLPEDNCKKLMTLIMDDRIEFELASAVDYVKTNVPATPAGKTVGKRTLAEIKLELSDPNGSVLASGSLTQLALGTNAVGTIDAGRIHHLMTTADTLAELKELIGPIVINGDPLLPSTESSDLSQPLTRLNKDAEVHALCLLIFWVKTPDLVKLATDLQFQYVHGGSGSQSSTCSLRLINKEERQRKATHSIYWRRCRFD